MSSAEYMRRWRKQNRERERVYRLRSAMRLLRDAGYTVKGGETDEQ